VTQREIAGKKTAAGEIAGDDIAGRISGRIAAEGPLSVAAFMALALHDPVEGYYARHQPIGAAGDFTTAPEISQIFGELVGLWCALAWEEIGRPDPVGLAELGPGRGVLAADLLRAAAALPEFRRALRLYLVEASPRLRLEQQRRLAWAEPVWLQRADELPEGPLLLVANEFLDALPIRQFVRTGSGWAERLVTLGPAGELAFADGRDSPAAALFVPEGLRRSAPPGSIVETCRAALALAAFLGRRFARAPGAALFIDYGYLPSRPGSTLRAWRRHRPAAVLSRPGTADLSAEVDFAAVSAAARAAGGEIHGPVAQGRFLAELGAGARLEALAARASPAQRQALERGLARLLDPAEMGEKFKAMAVTTPGLTVPGFGCCPEPAR
jgi:NADH dehydrogenase [ubiquinone] 1 alpha subcomplex assembly factor 7